MRACAGAESPAQLVGGLRRDSLRERDWELAYREHFQPVRCAPGLWIVPTWSEIPDQSATVIRLDPGLAFGTGSHPTTALCLAWLAASPPTGQDVIDYGCGSGILAIAACKLGAARALAVDIDAQALQACAANRDLNAVPAERLPVSAPESLSAGQADLLIANILAGPLIDLAPRFATLLRPRGRILLSGILDSQLEAVQSAYAPDFELDPATCREEWACLGGVLRR
jgi:ribosomal protein L11 methyltransferase